VTMSAGLLAVYSASGAAELGPFVHYGLKAMLNRGERAEAYVLTSSGVREVNVRLAREARVSARGTAAVGCVSPDGGCCAESPGGVRCAVAGSGTYVELRRDGVVIARRGTPLWHLALGAHGFDFIVVATESAAIEILGGSLRRSLLPGETVEISEMYVRSSREDTSGPLCALELIYTSRPDSRIDGVEVAAARERAARLLASKITFDVDVVTGIPETGAYYAASLAAALGKPYVPAFVVTERGRSALLDETLERVAAAQLKAGIIESAVRDRRVLLVDDSLISGMTIKLASQLLRHKAGALEVYAAIAAPPLRRRCPHGLKMPPESHMLFNAVGPADAMHVLEVDGLVYLTPGELEAALGETGLQVCTLCMRRER